MRVWTPPTRYTLMTYAESVQCVQCFFKLLYTILYTSLLFLSSLLKKYGQYGHCGHIGVFPREFMVFQCPLVFSGVDRVDTSFDPNPVYG